jgi:hypothetical protein
MDWSSGKRTPPANPAAGAPPRKKTNGLHHPVFQGEVILRGGGAACKARTDKLACQRMEDFLTQSVGNRLTGPLAGIYR